MINRCLLLQRTVQKQRTGTTPAGQLTCFGVDLLEPASADAIHPCVSVDTVVERNVMPRQQHQTGKG